MHGQINIGVIRAPASGPQVKIGAGGTARRICGWGVAHEPIAEQKMALEYK